MVHFLHKTHNFSPPMRSLSSSLLSETVSLLSPRVICKLTNEDMLDEEASADGEVRDSVETNVDEEGSDDVEVTDADEITEADADEDREADIDEGREANADEGREADIDEGDGTPCRCHQLLPYHLCQPSTALVGGVVLDEPLECASVAFTCMIGTLETSRNILEES